VRDIEVINTELMLADSRRCEARASACEGREARRQVALAEERCSRSSRRRSTRASRR
jgi:ribosome-binding ATPase YchF (GTP1/OBG family)